MAFQKIQYLRWVHPIICYDHKEIHSEFIAHYHFHCDNLKKLIGAEIGFFTVFPSAHELEAKWITPKGQGAAELTAKSSRLSF